MNLAYGLFKACRDYSGMCKAFVDCITSFSYYAAAAETSQEARLEAAKQNAQSMFSDIEGLESVAGEDAAAEEMLAKVEQYADTLRANGVELESRGNADTPAQPAAQAPAKRDLVAPLQTTYEKLDATSKGIRSIKEEQPLKAHVAQIRQFYCVFGDKIGWIDHNGQRTQRVEKDNDPSYLTIQSNIINAMTPKEKEGLDRFYNLIDRLWARISKDVEAYRSQG